MHAATTPIDWSRPRPATARRPAQRLEAVIFDWAGTTVDHGCMAPVASFIEVFRRRGVLITVAEARVPMGTAKRTHIERLTQIESIAERWRAVHGRLPTSDDVDEMFAEFVPLQVACLPEHAEPIDGVVDVVTALRRRGVKIGSTTGFTRPMMDVLLPEARRRGYAPDVTITASEVSAGRPYPFMCLMNVLELGASSVRLCVKVDDTVAGIEEGLRAGMWTVGVTMTGNEVGLPRAELDALDPVLRNALATQARMHLGSAGAHYIIESVAELMPCLDDIEARLSRGEQP